MREVSRKAVHLIVGVTMILIVMYLEGNFGIQWSYNFLFGLLVASLLIDFLIADFGWRVPIYEWVERKKERFGFHSSTHMVLGILVAFLFFDFDIALAAVGMLVFGDAMAALVGQKFGKPFYRRKSIAGTSAMFVTSLIVCAYFVTEAPIVATMAISGTIIEVFVLHTDDNIMIPVFSGLIGMLLRLII